MVDTIRLCLFCKKCQFNEGYHYSDYTHEDPSVVCYADDRAVNGRSRYAPSDKSGFQKWNRAAEACPFYEPDND